MRLNSGVLLDLWFRGCEGEQCGRLRSICQGTLVNSTSFPQAIFAPTFDWMPCIDSWSFILAEECGRWNDEAGTWGKTGRVAPKPKTFSGCDASVIKGCSNGHRPTLHRGVLSNVSHTECTHLGIVLRTTPELTSSSFVFSLRYSKPRRDCNLPTNTHCATSQGRQAER
ncbi:hypothetical protein QR685DRAFT_587897 [Neurospora intermedia]|uniref:Uncharacterized protein n=1 Tax=Neurospora intermedia TaxID=5142 RepID=A0ABR3DDV0_NEUIN